MQNNKSLSKSTTDNLCVLSFAEKSVIFIIDKFNDIIFILVRGISEHLEEIKIQNQFHSLKIKMATSNRQTRSNPSAGDSSSSVMEQLVRISDQLAALSYLPAAVKELRDEVSDVKHSIDFNGKVVEDISKKITAVENKLKMVDLLKTEVDSLKVRITDIQDDMEQRDQWARRSNIELVGVPERKGEHLINIVTSLAQHTGFDLDPKIDIDFVTRVAPKEPKKGQHKPIIIKMQARYRKDDFLAAIRNKRNLVSTDIGCGGDSRVYANDHLTSASKRLLHLTKEAAKQNHFRFVWVRNCRILVRKSEGSQIRAILKAEDLNKII